MNPKMFYLRLVLICLCLSVVSATAQDIHVSTYGELRDALRMARTSENGYRITMSPGTFDVESTLVVPSNVSLLGAGIGVTILKPSICLGSPVIVNISNSPPGGTDSNITISNLTVDGNCIYQVVKDNSLLPTRWNCDSLKWNLLWTPLTELNTIEETVRSQLCDFIIVNIEKILVDSCGYKGNGSIKDISDSIRLANEDCKKKIKGFLVGSGLSLDGIWMVGPKDQVGPSIRNLVLQNVQVIHVATQGINIKGENIFVGNCEVNDVGWDGIHLQGNGVHLSNSIATHCADNGIEIENAKNVAVTNCTIRENYYGFLVRNSMSVTVSNCVSTGNEDCGFWVWAADSFESCRNISINGCVVDGNHTAGIVLQTEYKNDIEDVTINGNVVANSREKGIWLNNKKNGANRINHILIEGNVIHHIINKTDDKVIAGMYVSGADYVSVIGNTIYEVQNMLRSNFSLPVFSYYEEPSSQLSRRHNWLCGNYFDHQLLRCSRTDNCVRNNGQ